MIPIEQIKLNPSNPRTISAEKLEKLKKSLTEFPQMLVIRPMVVDENWILLGGNMRYLALKEMGHTGIPDEWIKQMTNLNQAEKDEFLIKDNLPYGEWQWDALQDQWTTDQLEAWGLDVPEYKIKSEAEEDDHDEDPETITTDIQVGDLFEIGSHRLLCGNATNEKDWRKLMASRQAHMIFTDPPYNVNYKGSGEHTSTHILGDHQTEENFRTFLSDTGALLRTFLSDTGALLRTFLSDTGALLRTFLSDTGALYVCYASRTHREFEDALNSAGFEVRNQIIWTKIVASMGWGDYRWKHEPILYAHKKGFALDFYGDRKQYTEWTEERTDTEIIKMVKKYRTKMLQFLSPKQTDEELLKSIRALILKQENGNSTIWRFNRDTDYQHPTQKPVQLVGKAIKNSSKKGNIITDPFIGSGTTMVASHQMGRVCFGMDLDPKHCQTVINRMLKLDPQLTIKRNGEIYVALPR